METLVLLIWVFLLWLIVIYCIQYGMILGVYYGAYGKQKINQVRAVQWSEDRDWVDNNK